MIVVLGQVGLPVQDTGFAAYMMLREAHWLMELMVQCLVGLGPVLAVMTSLLVEDILGN